LEPKEWFSLLVPPKAYLSNPPSAITFRNFACSALFSNGAFASPVEEGGGPILTQCFDFVMHFDYLA
jgi:hypothetical protein